MQVHLDGEEIVTRAAHTIASVGGTVTVFGGFSDEDNNSRLNDLHILDFARSRYYSPSISSSSFPSPRSYHSTCTNQLTMFVVGGFDGSSALDDVWMFMIGLFLTSLFLLFLCLSCDHVDCGKD